MLKLDWPDDDWAGSDPNDPDIFDEPEDEIEDEKEEEEQEEEKD